MLITPDRVIGFGVECRRVEGDRWTYVSLAPWPQVSPDGGGPMISMLEAGNAAFVQLSTQLDPPGDSLEHLRQILAGHANPALITLQSGISAVESVEVAVGPGDAARVVASSAGSGYPPFAAVFAVQATGDDRAAFEAALHGERGWITVTYAAQTSGMIARISADLADWTRIR